MKKLILFLIFPIFMFSQELPKDSSGVITYQEVIELQNLTGKQIYSKALEWFALRYNSANDVIQLKDENNLKVIGKGSYKIDYYSRNPNIYHTIIIESKDNKVKITLTNLVYDDGKSDGNFALEKFPGFWAGKKKLFTRVNEKNNSIIQDFKAFLQNTKSEW